MRTKETVQKFFGFESGQIRPYENVQKNPPLPESEKKIPLVVKNSIWGKGYAVIMGQPKEEQGQDSQAQIHGEHTRAYLGNKHKNNVGMQVLVSPQVRDGVNALAALKNMSAKDYVADLLKRDVEKNQSRIPHGNFILAERKKRPYHTQQQAIHDRRTRQNPAAHSH